MITRMLSGVFSLLLLLGLFAPLAVFAAQETIVIACADYQPIGDNFAGGETNVMTILLQMQIAGIQKADGFLCAGDYTQNYTVEHSNTGLASLKKTVSDMVTGDMVFVQGNHDEPTTKGLSPSGENDPVSGAYGVFVIHEDDYSWQGESDQQEVEQTAARLKAYLDDKLSAGWDKPIFVVSHLPLHHTMRTYNTADSRYGGILFDVLNEAAGKGLNLFFLYGHVHGSDDYMGGAAMYLKKGDTIHVCTGGDRRKYEEKTLQFTYMNAGYVGSYMSNTPGMENAVTMSVFRIVGNEVTVCRYGIKGLYDLKTAGRLNSSTYEDTKGGYTPNTQVYASPRLVTAQGDVETVLPTVTTTTTTTTATTTTTTTEEETTTSKTETEETTKKKTSKKTSKKTTKKSTSKKTKRKTTRATEEITAETTTKRVEMTTTEKPTTEKTTTEKTTVEKPTTTKEITNATTTATAIAPEKQPERKGSESILWFAGGAGMFLLIGAGVWLWFAKRGK